MMTTQKSGKWGGEANKVVEMGDLVVGIGWFDCSMALLFDGSMVRLFYCSIVRLMEDRFNLPGELEF